jgi:hypothetical protein
VVNSGAPPSALVNASFEIPALSSGYRYNPSAPGIGWTFVGQSGVTRANNPFGMTTPPDGVQGAFIQGTGSVYQALSLNAGSYTLSLRAAQRYSWPQLQPVRVTVDGTQIGALISPPSTSFTAFSISFSVATSGAHTIMFAGTDPADKTTFIDAVTLQ